MDDNNKQLNNNNNGVEDYKQDNSIEQAAKKAGKDIAKKITKETLKAVKKAAKEVIKKIIAAVGWKVILITIIVLAIIIILGLAWWTIKKKTYNSISQTVKTYTDNSGETKNIIEIDSSNRRLTINKDELIKNINEWIEKNNIHASTLGFSFEDDRYYDTLVKFLEAEAVSSYPDLRTIDGRDGNGKLGDPVEEGELQGIVKFYKRDATGKEAPILLEFKEYTEYRAIAAKFGVKLDDKETGEQVYTQQAEIESHFATELKPYFTLDEEMNVLVASLSGNVHKVTYSDYAKVEGNVDTEDYTFQLNVSRINYQEDIGRYTMPFEFPLALLMITKNPQFCEKVADLAMRSTIGQEKNDEDEPEIVIDIQDKLEDSYIKKELCYTSDLKLQKEVEIRQIATDKQTGSTHEQRVSTASYMVPKQVEVEPFSITEDWIQGVTPEVCVSKAITWIADYAANFQDPNPVEDNLYYIYTGEEDDESYTQVFYSESKAKDPHDYIDTTDFGIKVPSGSDNGSVSVSYKVNEISRSILEKKINKRTKITNNTTTYALTKIPTVNPKWARFLSLLKVDSSLNPQKYNLDDIHQNDVIIRYDLYDGDTYGTPETNLLNGKAALYNLLQTNSKTKQLEEIMRDLIDIYTGKKKAQDIDTEFLDMYSASEFIPATTLSYSGGISGTYTGQYKGQIQEKIWYALKQLGYSDVAIAGAMGNIDYESGGFQAGITEKGSGIGAGLCQWSYGRRTALENYAASQNKPWQDEDIQVDFLVAEISGQGPASQYASRRKSGYIREEKIVSTHDQWKNCADESQLEDATLHFMRFFESPKSKDSLDERVSRARKWYSEFQGQQIFATIDEIELTGENKTKMENLIRKAIEIANDDSHLYVWGAKGPKNFDCSGFVSYLYKEFFGKSLGSTNWLYNNLHYTNKISSFAYLQPGDIVWRDGHCGLYIGGGQIAEAKSANLPEPDQIKVSPFNQNKFDEAYRIIN